MSYDAVAIISCIAVVGIVGLIGWRVGSIGDGPAAVAVQMAVRLIGRARGRRARRM